MPSSEFRVNFVNGLQTITYLQQIREYYKNTNISVKFKENLIIYSLMRVQIAQKINSTTKYLYETIFN